VHEWLKCLRKSKQMALRNEYLALLLAEMKEMRLRKPFNEPPPRDQLKSLLKSKNQETRRNAVQNQNQMMDQLLLPLTPATINEFKGEFKMPQQFLEDQPVPKNGIICYGACFSRH
jgi:hypothetical protein